MTDRPNASTPPPPPPRPRPPAPPASTQPAANELPAPVRSLFSGLAIFKAIFAAISSFVFAVLGPFVLSQVAKVSSEQKVALDGVTAFFVARPYLIAAMCIPTFAASILAIVDRKRRWTWLVVTTLFLLAMLGILLLAMMKLLGPLYNPSM